MGVRDMINKFANANLHKDQQQPPLGGDRGQQQRPKVPPPVPHSTRPGGSGGAAAQPTLPPHPGAASEDHGNSSSADNGSSSSKPFIVVGNGRLVLESDGRPYRFASLNAPELLTGHEWEAEDTMRTLRAFGRPVTRTYTLTIKGTSPFFGSGEHISGWDAERQDWIFNEASFKKMDKVLALADQYDVRLIIPVINQDFGSVNDNWWGNFVDIIRYVKNPAWSYQEAKQKVDYFADRECIEATKKIFTFLLNRTNTVNGKRYGDDPTVLAWETGNEMQHNYRGNHPAPAEWTIEIAQHIKALAPRTLVMDGSFAKNDSVDKCYPSQVAKSPYVDLLSYHYYGTGDSRRLKKDAALAKKHGKVFIAGEYGFFDHPNDYAMFLSTVEHEPACGGSMVWSLRPHAAGGGFKVHREDERNCAYHAPGWPSQAVPGGQFQKPQNWDEKENAIITYIRYASYQINGEAVDLQSHLPLHPPMVWLNGSKDSVVWRGSAWANTYEIWVGPEEHSPPEHWQCIAYGVLDATSEGKSSYSLPGGVHGKKLKMRGVDAQGVPGQWSNVIDV